jgi:hypothetical protein
LEEVAVVSVRAKKLYRNELDEPGIENTNDLREAVRLIQKVDERRARRATPPFEAVTGQVRDALFVSVQAAAPFSMPAEEAVLGAAAYEDMRLHGSQDWRTSLFATPNGYHPLDPVRLGGGAAVQKVFAALSSAPDGLLFAETTYAFVRDQK